MAINETFKPDNVQLLHDKDGNIAEKYSTLILEKVAEQSIIPALAQPKEMNGLIAKFTSFAGGIGAYWVGEGERIQTSKPQWLNHEMVAHKVAVILPVSNEYLSFSDAQFFARMTPEVSKAFARKIDEAIIAGKDNPFAWDLPKAYAGDMTVEGDINPENIHKIQGLVEDNDFDTTDFISTRKNRSALRAANEVIGNETIRLFDGNGSTLDGTPLHETKVVPAGTLIALDRENLHYGIPQGMKMMISEDAQLSTVVASDNKPVNLFEQDLVAARFTMHFGFMMTSEEGVAAIVKGETAPK